MLNIQYYQLGTRIYVLSHFHIITSGFVFRVKMNLNYIYSTSFTLNSNTKFHTSLIFFEVKYVE
jgi:hypothetical protein